MREVPPGLSFLFDSLLDVVYKRHMACEVRTTGEFDNWLDGLRDTVAREAIAARLIRASLGNFGDHRPVGEGVMEIRIFVGAGYRAYFTVRQRRIVFMPCGGDKGSQSWDIRRAKEISDEID